MTIGELLQLEKNASTHFNNLWLGYKETKESGIDNFTFIDIITFLMLALNQQLDNQYLPGRYTTSLIDDLNFLYQTLRV